MRVKDLVTKCWNGRSDIIIFFLSKHDFHSRKNISKEEVCRHLFLVYVLIYPLSKFGGNRTNSLWVLAFYSVHFKWKKLIRENSAEYVNQTSSFYFRPKLKIAISLPIFNLFQWFLFYIRDFIWIITLTEKSKFEENCWSEGIL